MTEPPPLREVIARHGLNADKSLGQHFLLDLNITRKIARAADVAAGDVVIEVGPGPGGLTRALLETGAHVIAVEKDERCLAALAALGEEFPDRLDLNAGDALTFVEADAHPGPVKIVANLPYNISTPLLIKWLTLNQGRETPYWTVMALMFQREVADRILAPPGSKTYGRLSVIAQAASKVRRALDLPARAFTPPPNVDSSVVLFQAVATPHLARLEAVTRAAFSQRRKMLRASMRSLWGAAVAERLAAAGVDPQARAEDVSVDQYLKMAEVG